MKILKNDNGQAVAPMTLPITKQAFDVISKTEIRWLGNAGIMMNTHGTCLMIDPLLEGFDMPLLIDMPIFPQQVPALDAVLITHIDNDHFSRATCRNIKGVTHSFHAPHFVVEEMKKEDIIGVEHDIHETFMIKNVEITPTPVLHNWQKDAQKYNYREWNEEDYCGYWISTIDGTIWLPGDSKLLDEQLHMPEPDMILFDFADNEWHITLEGAITLANTYPNADLLCIHWGSVDAPDMSPFNGNPDSLKNAILHPERILVVAPGEPVQLRKKS